ncbi:hypothetical protein SAMN05443549_1053 [Flavobacterium fluvii]|uniref:Uncharacterized protein n=1 Tax=Flavobacterium fluvii TaxID=468056 RepID=A0A1M5KY02_9FLAO|nr:hypothetical protein [Flavobacterium fluvii]SHG57688.1 hypothetical protein SAMN05443549_1053 [Flavobacterium fluvii]
MRTNFKNQGYLLLTTGNDQIISIIICKPGLRSIKKKIIQAILEDFNANKAVILANATLIENAVTTIFKAQIDSDVVSFEEYFKLKILPAY